MAGRDPQKGRTVARDCTRLSTADRLPPIKHAFVDDQTEVSEITLQNNQSLFRGSLYPSTEGMVAEEASQNDGKDDNLKGTTIEFLSNIMAANPDSAPSEAFLHGAPAEHAMLREPHFTRQERRANLVDALLPGAHAVVSHRTDPQPVDLILGTGDTTDNNEGLERVEENQYAVARAVEDLSATLMEAQQVPPEDLQRMQITQTRRKQGRRAVCALLAICFMVLAGAVGITLQRDRELIYVTPPTIAPSISPPASNAPSFEPSTALDGLVAMEFTNHTLQALGIPFSPQYLAYEWLSKHPDFTSLAETEKKQLFAMVSFFFGMDGQQWPGPVQDDWLDYDRSVCNWFSSQQGAFFNIQGTSYVRPLSTSGHNPCNEDGELLFLSLKALDLTLLQSPSIPPEMGSLPSLKNILLVANNFQALLSDFIPAVTSQSLSSLEKLDIGYNRLSGQVPSHLGLMTKLTYLDLGGNNLVGPLPTELFQLTDLEHLGLEWSMLSALPTELGKLTKLTNLALGGNQFVAIPSEIFHLTNLQFLSLESNSIQGQLPSQLALIESLKSLRLARNYISGSIPTQMAQLTDLDRMVMYGNLLSGPASIDFAALTNLEVLWLANNAFSGSISSSLGAVTPLMSLHLGENSFTGPIPTKLGCLSNLVYLDLSLNDLSNSIPSDLSNLSNLKRGFYLQSNSLSGSIPTELGLLDSLMFLDVSANRLTGPIPTELGMLSTLEALNVNKNSITGTIPSEIGMMFALVKLELSDLALTGVIPSEVSALAAANRLRVLNISDSTNLSGTLPAELCSLQADNCACIIGSCRSCALDFVCTGLLCGCGCAC